MGVKGESIPSSRRMIDQICILERTLIVFLECDLDGRPGDRWGDYREEERGT